MPFLNTSFLLLTETGNFTAKEIVITIVCIAILLAAGYWIYKKYKSIPDGDEKLKELFESMKSIVITNILEALDNLKIDDKSSLADIEADFLKSIYDDIWNLFDSEIEKFMKTDNILYTALRKAITREKVEEYIATLFAEDTIQNKVIDIYNTAIEKKTQEMIEEDERLAEEMESYENGEVDADPVEELDPAVDINAPVEDQKIIPPVEEESDTVSKDDESIEILEEIKEETTEDPVSETDNNEELLEEE